jgi:anti-sigma-K factor RskA
VTPAELHELAPIFALGALDGDDLASFRAALPASPELQAEVVSFESVCGRLAHATATARPAGGLRARALGAVGVFPAPASARRPTPAAPVAHPTPWLAWAATLAAVTAGGLYVREHLLLSDLRRDAAAVRTERDGLEAEVLQARMELATLQRQLTQEVAFRELVGQRESRQVLLAGLEPAPAAVARAVWNPATREAVLLVAGLAPAPPGKVYEAWVIASGAPVPAGTFQVDASGKAVLRMPAVDETSRVKTFAVTIEPDGGTPAPTGSMVLAGAVS